MDAATILARAIALPTPHRREVPPEFSLQPVLLRPRQRKFSFRRASTGSTGSDLVRVTSPTAKRQPTVDEETEETEDKHEEAIGNELPDIAPHTPLSATFVTTLSSTESSSIVVVDPPSDIPRLETHPLSSRRKIKELKMNHCEMTTEILELFISAVVDGGVRYWDVGANKFGKDGIKLIALLFAELKPNNTEEESGRVSPTPVSSISSSAISTMSEAIDEPKPSPYGKFEFLSLEGTDLSSHQLDPLLDFWISYADPNCFSLCGLDLRNCRLGQDIKLFTDLFRALERLPKLRLLYLAENPLFANPRMIKALQEWLPRILLIRRIDLSSTGLGAQHLVELARILPEIKALATLDITQNPIYDMNDVEEEQEGQTEDLSGLTALEAAMRYCRQIIEVDIPEGGGVEGARLRYRILLRCFKNIEALVPLSYHLR
jgi:hypothetical protein